jgi:integrase
MATITRRENKSGTVSYIAQVRRAGYPSLTRAFGTRLEADHWAATTEVRAQNRTLVITASMTLGELIDEVVPYLKSPYPAALAYWKSELGDQPLRHVTRALIACHRDRLLGASTRMHRHKTTRPRGPTTVWMYLQQLHRVFELGRKELDVVDTNPVSAVRRPSLPRGRERFLDRDERSRLLEACRLSKSAALYAFVLFLMTTGARRGETCKLTWGRVDLEDGLAILDASTTKTRRTRRVALTPAVIDAIAALPCTSPQVFPIDLTAAFRTAVKRARISDFRLHDLRHTAASMYLESGATLIEIGRVLGHADMRSTDRYSHLADEQARALIQRAMAGVQ